MSEHTNSRLKLHYKIGFSQNDHGQTSIFDELVSGRGVKMLFMPVDPLNSGGNHRAAFSILGVLSDGRVEQRLFTLPTGNFATQSTTFYSVIFGNYFRTVLVFVTMVPMRGLVAWFRASKSIIISGSLCSTSGPYPDGYYRREVSQRDL